MDIKEIEAILEQHPFLKKPKYIYMIDDIVYERLDGLTLLYSGITPKWRKDLIALTKTANDETVVHEVLHTIGLGELGAHVLAPVLRRFRSIVPPMLKTKVEYQYVGSPNPKVRVFERKD